MWIFVVVVVVLLRVLQTDNTLRYITLCLKRILMKKKVQRTETAQIRNADSC